MNDDTVKNLHELMATAVAQQMRSLIKHRHRYLKAFIAVTGLDPAECEMVERRHKNGDVTTQFRKRGECARCASNEADGTIATLRGLEALGRAFAVAAEEAEKLIAIHKEQGYPMSAQHAEGMRVVYKSAAKEIQALITDMEGETDTTEAAAEAQGMKAEYEMEQRKESPTGNNRSNHNEI